MSKLCTTFAMAASLAACATPPNNTAATYQQYVDAMNAGQAGASAALWAEDARFAGGLACQTSKPCTSRAAIQSGFIDPAVAMKMQHVLITTPSVDGDGAATVRIELTWPSISNIAPGVQRIVGTDVVSVKNGLIVSKTFTPDLADAQTRAFYDMVTKRQTSAR